MANIVINDNLAKQINNISVLSGESFNSVTEKLIERAIKDMKYRQERNRQKWQEQKALKATVEELERRLAEKL
jgi:hypothetical protein